MDRVDTFVRRNNRKSRVGGTLGGASLSHEGIDVLRRRILVAAFLLRLFRVHTFSSENIGEAIRYTGGVASLFR